MREKLGKNKCVTLFISMLYISAFTFGGGFVIASFVKKRFVDELSWISEEEMLDMIALAQSCPGAIAVNVAIMVGWQMAGFWGMASAVLGTVIPPVTIMLIISAVYEMFAANAVVALLLKGMQIGVAVIILDVAWKLAHNIIRLKSWIYNLIMLGAFVLVFCFKVNVIIIILGSMVIGILCSVWGNRRNKA